MATSRIFYVFVLLIKLLNRGKADYQCACNYNVETSVFSSPSAQAQSIGSMYEFDCKENIPSATDSQWVAIAFEHKVGYVMVNPQIQVQMCPGSAPDEDKLPTTASTTSSTTISTTSTTTTAPTTPSTKLPTASTPGTTTSTQTSTSTSTSPVPTTRTSTASTTHRTTPSTTSSTETPTSPTTTSTTSSSTTLTHPTTSTEKTTASFKTPTASTMSSTTRQSVSLTSSHVTSGISMSTVRVVSGKPKLCPGQLQRRVQNDRNILTQYGDKCYEVVTIGKTPWLNAESYCKQYGGHLVAINTQGEQTFITNYLRHNFYHDVWVGLTDKGSGNQQQWVTGEVVSFTYWNQTRPTTGQTSDNCVVLSPSSYGVWMDHTCQSSYNYICEYQISSPQLVTSPGMALTTSASYTTTSTTSSGASNLVSGKPNLCDSSIRNHVRNSGSLLTQYGDMCFETVTSKSLTWSRAEQYCNTYGGHLVTINNARKQAFMYRYLTQNYKHAVWIGLTDSKKEGNFRWASGTSLGYLNWFQEPHNMFHLDDSIEDCAVLTMSHFGQWDDRMCSSTHKFICEYRLDGVPLVSTPVPTVYATNPNVPGDTSRCPNWIVHQTKQDGGNLGYYGNSCYELVSYSKFAHEHAVEVCRNRGGDLVDILDSKEQDYVDAFLQMYSPQHAVWIGLHDRNTENYYQWTSGAPVHYTNWIPGHKDNFVGHNQEDCVLIIPYKNGKWDDIECGYYGFFEDSGKSYPALCEYKLSSNTGNVFVG